MKSILRTASFQILVTASLLAAVASCDSLDVDPDIDKADGIPSTVYVRGGNTALIDMAGYANSGKATLKITSSTRNGQLTSLGAGVLQYAPQSGVSKTTDSFSYTITNSSGTELRKDSVSIVVDGNPASLPDGIYPADDLVAGVTAPSPVSVKPLLNDLVIGYSKSDLLLSIYKPSDVFPPYSGSARVSGDSIVYTPQANFGEADKIVYKLTLRSDTTVSALGLIYLTKQAACDFKLNDDSYISAEEFTQVRISALGNDQLCNAVLNYSVDIAQDPKLGTVAIDGGVFVYTVANLAANGFSDAFVYRVTIDGESKLATVDIRVNTALAGCKIEAVNDSVDLTTGNAAFVTIDVLQNDQTCNGSVALQITSAPTYGTASVTTDNGGKKVILYTPNPQNVNNDKLTYRISNDSTESFGGVSIKRLP